ncbi:MAG TPA: hypothetical protein VJ917_03720, partial [Saprospiraceae bacterium]|nr:hypothetical protein [Saprospiraceae bacterium]
MKRFLLLSILISVVFTGCDNDIDLTADYKTIPVMYAFIDPDADSNFIRVEKAFLGEGNALELAGNPDSIFFDDITVTITRADNQTFELEKIDGNTIGRPRQDGLFAGTPNWLYLLEESVANVRPNERIRLEVIRDEEVLGSAITTLVGGGRIITPNEVINFSERSDTRVSYDLSPSTGMLGLNLDFFYSETNEQGNFVPKMVTWQIEEDAIIANNETRGTYEFDGRRFYQFLERALDEDPAIQRRTRFVSLELISVGRELREVRDIQLANQ